MFANQLPFTAADLLLRPIAQGAFGTLTLNSTESMTITAARSLRAVCGSRMERLGGGISVLGSSLIGD